MENNNPLNKYYVHESSIIDLPANIGEGTKIWCFSHVCSNANIGRNCNIGQNVYIDRGVQIGNNVKIQNNVSVYSGVHVEDGVFLGPSCVFTNIVNPRSFIERKSEFKETVIKKGASIGANATIVCGNIIGKYAFIGSGAVVTKDIPDYALVVGNPSRIIGYVCECGNKLNLREDNIKYHCETCSKNYVRDVKTLDLIEK